MNEQNLHPGEYKLSQEEAKRGGKKSAESRRQRKAIKTAILEAIYAETEAGSTELEEMIGGMIRRVKKTGDPGTFEKIMEYVGKSPKNRREEEELELRKAQLEQKAGEVTDIEDLRALAEMINEPDADD